MNFKKITAIGTSVLIAGMTMGLAAAATYPAPFVQNGAGDFAVVYGTGAGVSPLDYTNADSLADALSAKVTSTVGLGDETVQIKAAGTDLLFGVGLSTVKGKITSTHLPTLLATNSLKDASGSIDYEQYLEIGAHAVSFGALADEDDYVINTDAASTLSPVLYLDQDTNDAWELIVEFDDAINFSSVRDGEDLVIAGKEFAVARDLAEGDDLVLYASAQTEIIPATETKTVTVEGESYEIYVEGANTDAETATIYINGDAESVTEGDTVYVGDQEFYINRIFMQTVPTPTASVEVFIGAEKLTLEYGVTNSASGLVEINGEEVDGVTVSFLDDGNLLEDVTQITFTFTPADLDLDSDEALYLEMGETIVDPVFGTIGLTFDSASLDLKDEEKDVVEFKRVAEELEVTFTNRNGDEYTFTPLYDIEAADELASLEWSTDLYTENTLNLAKNDLFVLQEGSGVDSYITRVFKVAGLRDTEITIQDISTGDSKTLEDGEEIFDTGVTVEVAGGVWDLSTDPVDTIYTENNVVIDLDGAAGTAYAATVAATPVVTTVTDDNADAFDVTITADDTGDGEFTIGLTDADWTTASGVATQDDEGENGYYLSDFGTYAEADLEDDTLVTFYVPEEEVTYNVYVGATAEGESETGAILVKDSEVASVATKNLIVVGGSCINSAAATLVGGAKCGDAWTAATNAGTGKFVIRSYSDNDLTSKLAVLVAGYDVADTTNAVEYFKNKVTDTSKSYLGTTATTAEVVVA